MGLLAVVERDYVALTEIYLARNRGLGRHWYEIDGRRFEVFENVFSPEVFEDTAFFARALLRRISQGSLLEVGSGAGVIAVLAALNGAAPVVATDRSPAAVENTAHNAELFRAQVQTRLGHLFEPIGPGERFDTIFWNPPFISHNGSSSDELARAVFDPEYRTLARYLCQGPHLLTPGGRLFFGFSSTSGDPRGLRDLAAGLGLCLRESEATVLPDRQSPGFSLELYEATRGA